MVHLANLCRSLKEVSYVTKVTEFPIFGVL